MWFLNRLSPDNTSPSCLCTTSLWWREPHCYLPQATLASGSCLRWASSTASLIWSHILSGKQDLNTWISGSVCVPGWFLVWPSAAHVTFLIWAEPEDIRFHHSIRVLHIIHIRNFGLWIASAWWRVLVWHMVHCNSIRSSKHCQTVFNYWNTLNQPLKRILQHIFNTDQLVSSIFQNQVSFFIIVLQQPASFLLVSSYGHIFINTSWNILTAPTHSLLLLF